MNRILIIEDDFVISGEIKKHLDTWGYQTKAAENFKDILSEFNAFDPHLIILDISLPFYNGYHWCTEIRKQSHVPIIFVSSASDNMNIVMAMNIGGDDFIAKPFNINILVAKIQALLRRTYDFREELSTLERNGASLNLSAASLTYQDSTIDLTKNDFKIIQILMKHAGSVVSRDDIMTQLWENDSFIDDNTLTVNVTRLRKKLEEIGLHDFIHTKKGLGYIIP
jgi:Response regulators consisting of a CheY-like receiver domain and a winged-helix DNA-binding domain